MNSQSIRYIAVDKLQFDPKNPRLPSTIQKQVEIQKTDDPIFKWMLEDATIIELMLSIGEKGYFPGEALLVVPHKNTPNYWVIEGNRRLTAVKLLLEPELAPIRKKSVQQVSVEAKYRPHELPVLVFSEREEILYYLGYRHITGIKTWGAHAKAKYLKQLLDSLGEGDINEQYKTLAKTIGSRADYVARSLTGYAVYEKIVENDFFNIKGLDAESIDFAVLTTALNYQNIPKFLSMENSQDRNLSSLNQKHLGELTSWMFERNSEGKTRLGESRNLGDLNSVVAHPKALEAFRKGEHLANAVLYTEKPLQVFRTSIIEAKTRLQVSLSYVHLVEDPSPSDSEILFEIQKLSRTLKTVIDEKLLDR